MKEMFQVNVYDHKDVSHNRGVFETKELADAEAKRLEKDVPRFFQGVNVEPVEVGI